MQFEELRQKIKSYPIFSLEDVFKWFDRTNRATLKNELSLWTKQNRLQRIKKGLYKFPEFELKDHFILARFICHSSYISLETALNYYGIMPDIPFSVTSVTNKKTVSFNSKDFGVFSFRHISSDLFFGFEIIKVDQFSYRIATPEKALFDFIYFSLSKIDLKNFPAEFRFDFDSDFDWKKFAGYSKLVKIKKFRKIKQILMENYAQ